ncbi:MAG: hypothetical protein ABWX69_07775 [Arthrobacter sp.]
MTGTREPQQDDVVHAMLRDSGLEGSTELRSSLDELRALAPDRAPAPRADVAALLAAGARGRAAHGSAAGATIAVTPTVESTPERSDEALPTGVASLAQRRARKRRLAVVGGAVVGAMTLGAGAVAASSEDFRASISSTVGVIFQPSGEAPDVAPKPSPSDVPAAPAPVPAGPAPAERQPEAPEGPAAPPAAPAPGTTPPAVGRDGVLPTPPRRPVTPGVPAVPGVGEGRSLPVKPLPAPTLPGVEPTKIPGPGGIIGDD